MALVTSRGNGLYLVMTSGGDPAADEIFISGEGNMTYTDV